MISRKLQFGVCNYDKPCASAHIVREGKLYYKGEKEVGMLKANRVHAFSLSCCQENEELFSFLLRFAIITGQEDTPTFWLWKST